MVFWQAAVLALAAAGAPKGETVLLDFYADWCIPCQHMAPAVQQLAAMGYPVQRVNFDQHRELAARFGVDRLPTFIMLVNGRVAAREVGGGVGLDRLVAMCRLAPANRPAAPTAPSVPMPAVVSGPAFSPGLRPGPEPLPSEPPPLPGPGPDWQNSAPRLVPTSASRRLEDDLVFATVRLRIVEQGGHSCGTGTIIDARNGEALILTCGHIFRDSQGRGAIEVDLFGPVPAESVPGRLIRYDEKRDIGLVAIRVPGTVVAAKVAPSGYRIAKNDAVINLGCNNGERPTASRGQITAIDKYSGPANLEVSGVPVQGRSGGGLFSAGGYLIGVCNAADPPRNEGLYAALSLVHEELDAARLSFVYQPGEKASSDLTQQRQTADQAPPPMPKEMPQPDGSPPAETVVISSPPQAQMPSPPESTAPQPAAAPPAAELDSRERAALEELRRRKAAGAEVVCVIRSLANPTAPSEVLVLDKVSPALLEQVAADLRAADRRQLTSLEVPGPSPTGQQPLVPSSGQAPPPVATSIAPPAPPAASPWANPGPAPQRPSWPPRFAP